MFATILCLLFCMACRTAGAAATEREQDLGEALVKPGFRLEEAYRVPASQGSWVCLTCDRHGRLVASDQNGKLYLISPAPIGRNDVAAHVEALPLDLGAAQGLACVRDDLYVVVNSSSERWKSGLHRARDTDGDRIWDASELLRELPGRGEHGPHAVLASRDGQSLFVCCGNHTDPTAFQSSRLPRVGPEDVLLARLTSPTPFQAIRRPPPGGWIARTDLDGRNWTLLSGGYRNQYDLAINRDGQLFTYDSDMEYDIGMPWYRPTRVCHVTSGSDFGWRSNSGPFPPHFPDTLPPVAELGPGSPTGLAFGYETDFPAPYRDALFAADWGRGVIHALQLKPDGASYTAVADSLVRATPLPVTDLAVNAVDGALYFTTGGRGTESALYRLAYVDEPPMRAIPSPDFDNEAATAARSLRRQLEELHRPDSRAVATAWPVLDDADRFIRYAARIAVEHQPPAAWRANALEEPVAGRRTAACLALARADSAASSAAVVKALSELDWNSLTRTERYECLRAYEVLMARRGPLSEDEAARVSDQLLDHFPDEHALTTRMMASVLTRLGDPRVTPRIVRHFEHAWDDEDRIHLAHTLCDVSVGWTPEARKTYFDRLTQIMASHHDSTLRPYLNQIASQSLELAPEASRAQFAEQIAAAQARTDAATLKARPFVRRWTVDEAVAAVSRSPRSPDASHGSRLFAEATCATCHQFQGRGGAVGPDLTTVASRFSLRDLLTAIVDPDQAVSDQYRQTVFEVGGRMLVGRIVDHRQGEVRIATDLTDPKRGEYVLLEDIDAQTPSEVSPMPRGLADTLTAEELADLVAFLQATP